MSAYTNLEYESAKIIQRFFHRYVAYHQHLAYDNQWYYQSDRYDTWQYDDERYCDEQYCEDPYASNGMFTLRNGNSTDDWETYIDDVYG